MPSTPKPKSLTGEVIQKKMGRPSKLTPEAVMKAWEYIRRTGSTSAFELLPTIEGLAEELDITRETLYDWEKTNDDFSDILKRLRQRQADKLIQNALVGKYNPLISKLMLSKHGYVERTEVDNNINMAKPILGGLSTKQIEADAVHSDPDDV